MKLKSLAAVVASGLSLAAFDASACAFTAWVPDTGSGTTSTAGVATDTTGTPLTASLIAGKPTTDTDAAAGVQGVPRIAGGCGSFAKAAGNFTTDGSPNIEAAYRARFYVRAGNDGAVVFRALNAAAAPMITITYNAAGFVFATTSATTAQSQAVTPNRWYAIEINWAAGQAMSAVVQGAGSSTPLNIVNTGAAAAGDRIDAAQLGWISGGSGTPIAVDAFESRRTTAIGRLCRADANNDGIRNSTDGVVIRNEFLSAGSTQAIGLPDGNEDGVVNSTDGVIVRNIFLAGLGACSNPI